MLILISLGLTSLLVGQGCASIPEFIYPIDNITVAAGRDAHFTCVVNNLEGHKVAWLRSDSKAILAIHNHMVTNNPRMTVSHNGHNTWKLHIRDVQRNDSGHYMCQINTEPMVSQIGMLEVVEAPDILYNETSHDTITMEGASVNLKCEARGYPQPTITWQREDKQPIVIRGDAAGGSMKVKDGIEGNTLILTKLTRADGGAYLCIAQNGVPSPVSKRIMVHVHFHPSIHASQNLLSIVPGTDATLECKVEASPKSVNYWVKVNDGGGKDHSVNNGGRFQVDEVSENSYTQRMQLRINNVRPKDFGTYACLSYNSLGEVKTNVQLQEMKLEPSTQHPDISNAMRSTSSSELLATIHQEISTVVKRKRKEGMKNKKKKANDKKEDTRMWEHHIVPLEEKDKFEHFENKFAPTYPDRIPTQTVGYEYRNGWGTSSSVTYQLTTLFPLFQTLVLVDTILNCY